MRTIILILGLIFLSLLEKHWGLGNGLTANSHNAISLFVVYSIILDIIKKI